MDETWIPMLFFLIAVGIALVPLIIARAALEFMRPVLWDKAWLKVFSLNLGPHVLPGTATRACVLAVSGAWLRAALYLFGVAWLAWSLASLLATQLLGVGLVLWAFMTLAAYAGAVSLLESAWVLL